IPSGTASPVPTATNPPPSATATSLSSVAIIAVNKPAEYVEIQNFSQTPVNLCGWRLVSETGNQSCNLRGTLEPNEVLRVWARRGNPGFDCRLGNNDIWLDNAADPAVLYNPQGEEVSRFP
ncbi:MAG TPA: lamin tail domain-containing protein, partial [Anaerolineales bacterium]|nr:lamin tail domain-containing protein [Anaerolineales bacterium]